MGILQRTQLYIKAKVLGECKNYVGKIIRHPLEPEDILKKTSISKNWHEKFLIQTSKRKLNKLLPRRLSPSNGVTAVQSFTLAKSNIFWRRHSVANSHQNCVSGFQTVIMFNVQMFSNPAASFKTGKSSLQTGETSKKYLCFFKSTSKTVVVYILYQLNIWCTKQSELENKISSKKWNPHSANPLSGICSRKSLQTANEKEFKKWCLHLNTQE